MPNDIFDDENFNDEDREDFARDMIDPENVIGQAEALLAALGHGTGTDVSEDEEDDRLEKEWAQRRDTHEEHMKHVTKLLEDGLSKPHEGLFEALCDQGRILDEIFRASVLQSCDVNTLRRDPLAIALKAQTQFRLAYREARIADKEKK